MTARRLAIALLAAAGLPLGGCALARLAGGMAQNYEYSKLVEVHPAYDGLENSTVAVIVDADMMTRHQYPDVCFTVAANIAHQIQTKVPGARVLSPDVVQEWQFRTPQWSAMPYGEVARRLGVDRVVHVDIYEYRLHPPGNSWLWEGVCAANLGIIERDGYDPDSFVDTFRIRAAYPDVRGLGRESAEAGQIQTGLLALFVRDASWLFYTHLEPKHPDKYEGEIPEWEEET